MNAAHIACIGFAFGFSGSDNYGDRMDAPGISFASEGMFVKRRWLALTALLSVASACNQAPDDDPISVRTPRASDAEQVRQGQQPRGDPVPIQPVVKYELQGAPRGVLHFPSLERCERERISVTVAQAKTDNERSEHGVLVTGWPMLACVPI